MSTGHAKTRNRPDPDLLTVRLSRLVAMGHAARVAASVDELGSEYIDHAGLNQALSEILIATHEFDKAVGYARIAARLDPLNAQRALHLALCLVAGHRDAEAREVLNGVATRLPESAASFATLASVFVRANDHARAVELYERAIARAPHDSRLHFGLAAVQRFLGELEAAERSCDTAIALNPREYEAYLIRADLRTQTVSRNHIAELQAILQQPIDHYLGESMLCHAIAKECEDVGEHANGFAYLQRGASLRRRHLAYDVTADLAVIAEIIRRFDRAAVSSHETLGGLPAEAAVFVIGMPRTGTTLVERMLGAHPQVRSLGELPDFPRLVAKLGRGTDASTAPTKLQLVQRSLYIESSDLGSAYLNAARALAGDSARFIDKLPFNYLNVGLIHRSLPAAKIVHVMRDPMDTCYAIYKTLFRNAYPFSYSLDDLAAYFIAYYQLMDHWRAVLPGRMLEVRYENLVRDPEKECRCLIAHCGLDWDASVLAFNSRTEASTTASASQVRRPVYTSSIGKWKHYATELEPLTRKLEAAGISFAGD